MRKIFLMAGIASLLLSCSTDGTDNNEDPIDPPAPQRTQIPDTEFERALVELNIDDKLDGSVLTSEIAKVVDLIIEDKGITDLTGIDDFTNLVGLWVSDNSLQSLNVSGNSELKFVFANDNQLRSINVSSLSKLEKISVLNNEITQLNISGITTLQQLSLANNLLAAIDISDIPDSIQLNTFDVQNNPLTCIRVNEEQLNNIPAGWKKDDTDTYELECNL